MKSKVERVKDSIDNMEAAIDYYLKDADSQFQMSKIPKSDYLKIVKNLNNIRRILSELKFKNPVANRTINEIRRVNLSISSLYEDGDYNTMFSNIITSYNNIISGNKNTDKELLSDLKRLFNYLSNFYKYRLSKAVKKEDGDIGFKDKGFNNVKFVTENYLKAKYFFKKIPFETINISGDYQQIIDVCVMICESDTYSEEIKNICYQIKALIIKMANSETVIRELEKLVALCNQKEFLNLLTTIKRLIEKYASIYNNAEEKYSNLITYLKVNQEDTYEMLFEQDYEYESNESDNVELEEHSDNEKHIK